MKAMVLAAGFGTRMRPLTHLRAKAALPVLNRPLLHWTLELLARHGVTDVIVNLHHLPRTVRECVGNGQLLGVAVTYSYERRILGTGGGPRRVRRFFGDEPFFLVNGDVLFDFDLSDLVRKHKAAGAAATLALRPNPDPRVYSPVVTDGRGRVRSLAGRPLPASGRVSLFTGVHVIEPRLLDRLPAGPSDTVRDLYAQLVEGGDTVLGVRVRGAWYDLGDPSLYLESQVAMLASGFRGTRRSGAMIDPSAAVDPSARITRAVVGPGCRIEKGARVVRSVLWDGVVVEEGAEIRDSILTSRVRVGKRRTVRDAVRLRRRG